jgi:Fe/S biogenesis protein NfuA
MIPEIRISDAAKAHFRDMLGKQDGDAQLRIYVINPGTSLGHCGIAYWRASAGTGEDAHLDCGDFRLYYRSEQAPYLDGATVDCKKTFSGHTLALQAPKAKQLQPIDENSPLALRITHVLETEVNPHLAEHSGTVMLGEIREDGAVTLKFGGGCHGCGHAELTLHDTVEKTLKERFPEITVVIDATVHSEGSAPYIPRDNREAA